MLVKNLDFERELDSVLKEYSQLKIKKTDNTLYLKGILDIPDDENNIGGSFAVEIYSTAKFPYRFPKLLEVGGDIPCEADWHKYSDNSCCITVPANEILICKNGVTILRYIKDFVIPYFANQLYRKQEGKFFNEYSHGVQGVYEFYIDLFHTKDHGVWIKCLNCAMGKSTFKRYNLCYCGSNVKYKKCHLKVENNLRKIGWEQVLSDFKSIGLL